jgi:hypothetical protein
VTGPRRGAAMSTARRIRSANVAPCCNIALTAGASVLAASSSALSRRKFGGTVLQK